MRIVGEIPPTPGLGRQSGAVHRGGDRRREDPFLKAVMPLLGSDAVGWTYRELDPDVFGEELDKPGYERVERIAVVALTVTRLF